MPVEIKNVLICDAVDQSCVDLLKNNGINVSDYEKKKSIYSSISYFLNF